MENSKRNNYVLTRMAPASMIDYSAGDIIHTFRGEKQHNAQIIGFMSGKGGVGKTGLSINIANFCAQNGDNVLLVDCDIGTNGATMFFCIDEQIKKQLRDFNDVFDFQDILSGLLNEDALGITPNFDNALPVSIDDNFDFIPAGADGNIFDEQELTDELMLKLEEKLEQYFSVWRKRYDLIILDFGAGEGKINSLLSKVADNICIVMHSDELSRQAVKRKLGFVFKEHNIDDIKCCVNMVQGSGRMSNTGVLFNEFNGFEHSPDYSKLFEKGAMIEIGENDLCKQLSFIVKSICRESNAVNEYNEKMNQERLIREKRRNEEIEEMMESQEQKRKLSRCISVFATGLVLIIALVLLDVFLIDIKVWQYALGGVCFAIAAFLIIGSDYIAEKFDEFTDLFM